MAAPPGAPRFFPMGRTKSSSVCLRQPPSPTAPSTLGKALGCVLNWGGGFLGELIWSLNSPLDCPEPSARPTGLRPSIHPHPSIMHRASSSRKPGVPVGLLSPNSPLDCPEPNARPTGCALHAPPSSTAPSALGKAFGGACALETECTRLGFI